MKLFLQLFFFLNFTLFVLFKSLQNESTRNCDYLFSIFKLLLIPFYVWSFLLNQFLLLLLFLLLNFNNSFLFLLFCFFSFLFKLLIFHLLLILNFNFFFFINQTKIEHIFTLINKSLNFLLFFDFKLWFKEFLFFDWVLKDDFFFV